jgi:hypothetical protein
MTYALGVQCVPERRQPEKVAYDLILSWTPNPGLFNNAQHRPARYRRQM